MRERWRLKQIAESRKKAAEEVRKRTMSVPNLKASTLPGAGGAHPDESTDGSTGLHRSAGKAEKVLADVDEEEEGEVVTRSRAATEPEGMVDHAKDVPLGSTYCVRIDKDSNGGLGVTVKMFTGWGIVVHALPRLKPDVP
eukprot:CAMPEP_0205906944 /NCGR_PEP_ID=MMETSP1325-20131115/2229_1 /ASSEMBLY_ACC=CAM_ASM_000708 /TAXON_ID=236786 /ORGANISM="Florenciella sp., Strain RCC1007" /LENGTH=139 /DNA_ID=CAMNT_0053272993 /DNA_START=8 /DNA_END=423 /DNA_ORIENTATION=-